MKLYHGATRDNAKQILADGFQDLTSNFGLFNAVTGDPVNTTGVFFSNVVLDENEGVSSETYFVLNIPDIELTNYEWFEEGKGYREWCVPADLANLYLVDRTVYSWEELQMNSESDRRNPIGQAENILWPSDSFYQSSSDTGDVAGQERLSVRELVCQLYKESIAVDPGEFLGLLDVDDLVAFNHQSEQIMHWLIATRELIRIEKQ